MIVPRELRHRPIMDFMIGREFFAAVFCGLIYLLYPESQTMFYLFYGLALNYGVKHSGMLLDNVMNIFNREIYYMVYKACCWFFGNPDEGEELEIIYIEIVEEDE